MGRRGLLGLLLAGVAGCSPLPFLNAVIPTDGYRVIRNLPYAEEPRQHLDVYLPTAPAHHPARVVVFFYGGRWQFGSREDYLFAAQALVSRGLVVVIPDYRLYPQVRFPGFVEDGARAVEWVKAHISAYGGDPDRIYLMGHSAGAHIAALLALDSRYLERGTVRGLVGLAGPYDFLPLESEDLKQVFNAPPDESEHGILADTQPITFADGADPPVLLLTGRDDTTVDPGNSLRLARKLQELGGEARVTSYPDLGHAGIVGALAAPLRHWAPVLEDSVGFILEH